MRVSTVERVRETPGGAMRALLKRCRSALDWEDAEWEMDLETAAAADADLVREIDAVLVT
ncbi:MAG: hypothetical protein Q8R92_05995 [Deltaproteobacteria bacterium]|nr:hypothetical protein [Deltaproteobacteria bacterium]